MPGFYEFFAGGGMVRAGLGAGWTCLFANDFDARKGLTYQANWGTGGELTVGDVRAAGRCRPARPARPGLGLLSLPGPVPRRRGAGLAGRTVRDLLRLLGPHPRPGRQGRAPRLVAVENVCGALTSHGGRDFEAICRTFAEAGYRFGALVINADLLRAAVAPAPVRHRRPAPTSISTPDLLSPEPIAPFHTPAVVRAVDRLPDDLRARPCGGTCRRPSGAPRPSPT